MKGCKLTDSDGCTYNSTQWGEGVTHEAAGEGDLCGPGWLHFYDNCPELAVVLAPLHSVIHYPRMWECIAEGKVKSDRGLKYGCTKLTTVREIPMPEVSTTQRVAFGILCAMEVCREPEWLRWAEGWLSGEDRSKEASEATAEAGRVGEWAAQAAAWAAWAAAWAEWLDGSGEWSGLSTERKGESTLSKKQAGERAAEVSWSVSSRVDLDLKKLAKKAMTY